MDAEERALLAAIVAHPDEDTPRLVYADWLQEHDRPERAEFIRAQIGLARTKGTEGFERQRHEWSRSVRSLHAHSKRWRKALPPSGWVRLGQFVRGMVDSGGVAFDRWTPELAAMLDRVFETIPPRLLRVSLYSRREALVGEWAAFLKWPGLDRFAELVPLFSFGPHPIAERVCAVCEHLATREWGTYPRVIDLHECPITDEAARILLAVPPERSFPALVLRGTGPAASVRAALAARFGTRVRFA